MSLILEALKKSEAERQLGRAPGLTTPMPTARRPSVHYGVVAWIAVLALSLAALLAWRLLVATSREPAPADSVVDAPAPSETADAERAPSSRSTEHVPSDVGRDAALVAEESAPSSPRPPATSTTAPMPHDAAFDSVERESSVVAASAAVSPQDEPAAPLHTADAAASTSRRADDDTAIPAVVPSRAEPLPDIEEPFLPDVGQLDAGLRGGLPPLRLSMHVFAEDRRDRFVLIDGRRYGEGAAVAEGLRVTEIRRDGAVLEQGGVRFLLRRP